MPEVFQVLRSTDDLEISNLIPTFLRHTPSPPANKPGFFDFLKIYYELHLWQLAIGNWQASTRQAFIFAGFPVLQVPVVVIVVVVIVVVVIVCGATSDKRRDRGEPVKKGVYQV